MLYLLIMLSFCLSVASGLYLNAFALIWLTLFAGALVRELNGHLNDEDHAYHARLASSIAMLACILCCLLMWILAGIVRYTGWIPPPWRYQLLRWMRDTLLR